MVTLADLRDRHLRTKIVPRQTDQSQHCIPRKPSVWVSGAEIHTSAVDTRTVVWGSTAENYFNIVLGETRNFSRKFGVVSAPALYKNPAVSNQRFAHNGSSTTPFIPPIYLMSDPPIFAFFDFLVVFVLWFSCFLGVFFPFFLSKDLKPSARRRTLAFFWWFSLFVPTKKQGLEGHSKSILDNSNVN